MYKDSPKRFAAVVGVLLIVFSFQANYELADSKVTYYIYYGTLLLSCVVVFYKKVRALGCIIMVLCFTVGTMFFAPTKALGFAVIIPFGYYTARYQKIQLEKALLCTFYVNFVLVFAQLIGWSESVYKFTHYNNEGAYISFIEEGLIFSGFLPQIRPSGVFPSPTYISSFCVLFFALVIATNNFRNRFVFFLFGIHLAMLGSTVGLCLCIISIPLIKINTRFFLLILGYIITLAAFAFYLPEQFSYNFNFNEIGVSFFARFDIANSAGESVVQQNLVIFLLMCLTLFLGLFKIKRISALVYLVPFAIALMLPALVHNISFSIFYWFLIGGVFGTLVTEVNMHNNIDRDPSHLNCRLKKLPNPL